jgi:hypothetical protein
MGLGTSVATLWSIQPAHPRCEHLAQRAVRALAHRLGHASAPARDRQRIEVSDRHGAERIRGLDEVVAQPIAACGGTLVLLQEHVDQLAQRHVGPVQRAEAGLAQRVVEDLLGLGFRAEAAALAPHAATVAEADGPAARGALDLPRP